MIQVYIWGVSILPKEPQFLDSGMEKGNTENTSTEANNGDAGERKRKVRHQASHAYSKQAEMEAEGMEEAEQD